MEVVKMPGRDEAYVGEVVERLKMLLEAAEKGEILSIAYTCDRPGGIVTSGSTRIKDRFMLLGYLANHMYLLHQSIEADSKPSNLDEAD